MNKKKIIDLVIIGGGPAGFTSAIYAGRAGLNHVLFQGATPGGQLMNTTEVENYPGYPKGILGPDMMEDFRRQALRFGTEERVGIVTSVNFNQYPFSLTIDETELVETKAVIIATGSSAKWLNLPSEKKFNGRGVSACAICDGFFFKGEAVAVVGGGDTAAEEALYLSKICPKVYLLVRRDVMRASAIMQKRLHDRKNIHILWNTVTEEILGEDTVTGVRIKNQQTNERKELSIKGFFIAIGHSPNTKPFKEAIKLDAMGYIVTKPKSTETSIEGVFAAGDVQDPKYRQAVTAAATGCMAALDAERFLNKTALYLEKEPVNN